MKLSHELLIQKEHILLEDVEHTFLVPTDWILFELYRRDMVTLELSDDLDLIFSGNDLRLVPKDIIIPLLEEVFENDEFISETLRQWANYERRH